MPILTSKSWNMKSLRSKFDPAPSAIAMIGASCRIPGASSPEDFWRLLVMEQNVIQARPSGRWSIERFLREGEPAPGFAYSFAGGYLDHPFQFDPMPFGMSSREAAQTDPQQRLLLELVWQAFEDAGVFPEKLNGLKTGVYVGASNVDYQGAVALDVGAIESHFMTGNSLAILANRISYVFDFKGPSITVDTACSSSLAALQQATRALEAGDIDLALVAGVNLLLSPTPFIGFSQARMLSPTGRSRPFSADADGYVRAEGGAVILLSRAEEAARLGLRVRSYILGCALNSDGLTSGIALPSREGQRSLIEDLYRSLELDPEALAFVEAHGTGTQAGDPIEAEALGEALGRKRRKPLAIGSVKSNIGHLEAASGLVGLLKASLALEHRLFPRSLFSETLNDAIDFHGLNLEVAQRALPLEQGRNSCFAGVCNYGFGGTNAHVVLASPRTYAGGSRRFVAGASLDGSAVDAAKIMVLSAGSPEALKARALQVCAQVEEGFPAPLLAAAYVHQQPLMTYRLAMSLPEQVALAQHLRDFAHTGSPGPEVTLGAARGGRVHCAFIFSGNGAQFLGMGALAYAQNTDFRHEIDKIDQLFKPLARWSIAEALQGNLDPQRFERTSVIQPLIFAIQSALAATLARYGVRPAIVLGHSIGEIAAAECSGALTREQALRIIIHRSKLQESVRGEGCMLVAAADQTIIAAELRACGVALEIAALNSQVSTTVVGPHSEIQDFVRHCRARRIATVEMGMDYPFHSRALDRLEGALRDGFADIYGQEGRATFISTVTGRVTSGAALDPAYWWGNARSPVRFQESVCEALKQGANLFVELGPHPILASCVKEILGVDHASARVFETLTKSDQPDRDPVLRVVAQLVANGMPFNETAVVGPKPPRPMVLPGYPFQRERILLRPSSEAISVFGTMVESVPRHPLLGARVAEGSHEWRNLLDPVLLPYLRDHQVNGAVVVPASGLIEIALAAGRDLYGKVALTLSEFDILSALVIGAQETRELSVRFAEMTGIIEICSRRRFSGDHWLLHARGRIEVASGACPAPLPLPNKAQAIIEHPDDLYAAARRCGIEYGQFFRLVTACWRDQITAHVQLDPPLGGLGAFSDIHVLHPISFDAAFHALSIARPSPDDELRAHLPIRFRKIHVFEQGAIIRQAVTHLTQESERYKTLSIHFLDGDGTLVAAAEGVALRAVWFSRVSVDDRTFRRSLIPLGNMKHADALDVVRQGIDAGTISKAWLLTRAFCLSLAHRVLKEAMADSGASGLLELRKHMLVATEARPYFDVLVHLLSERTLLKPLGDDLVLSTELELPAPETLLASLMHRYPEASFEIQAASIVACSVAAHLRSGAYITPPVALQRRFESASSALAPSVAALEQALVQLCDHHRRRLRILALEPDSMGLARAIAPLVEKGLVEVTLAVFEQPVPDRHMNIWGQSGICTLNIEAAAGSRSAPAPFDALVGLVLPGQTRISQPVLAAACKLLAPEALVLITHPTSEPSLDMLLGLWKGWLPDGVCGAPKGSLVNSERLIHDLQRTGVGRLAVHAVGDGLGRLVSGVVVNVWKSEDQHPPAEFVIADEGDFAAALGLSSAVRLTPATAVSRLFDCIDAASKDEELIVYVLPHGRGLGPVEEIALRLETVKDLLGLFQVSERKASLMIITEVDDTNASRAEDHAMRGFVRVAMNEYPMINLRMIEVNLICGPVDLRQVISMVGDEREITLGLQGVAVQRIQRGISVCGPLDKGERSVLEFRQTGRFESFEWVKEARSSPKAGEIEIEVAATGLNFRDVMVALGALDEDILHAGLTKGALGFECSGTVLRTGAGVDTLAPGDRVMGFASNAFASHLVAPAWQFILIPPEITFDAAATIPVAFATAWHSLMERAHLREGDDVLIHGAAGGVGLAAIQVAKRAGARVIGTASNEARRAIATAQGADLVFDSRGGRFVEAVRVATGGVDVVLNSLDGEAMLASFHLLRPFGRFIELGKKDFFDNTHLGLRPFVRNIMYSGVDLDELLMSHRKGAGRIMAVLASAFENGELHPLPHQIYEAHEIGAAFRAMQASEHIGKIVIRPAKYGVHKDKPLDFKASDGAYLVVGGTSGFGFATAQWLARKGASTIMLASRRGEIDAELKPDVERLRQSGVKILVETLDVRDSVALTKVTQRLIKDHGPLRGVVHAAVHLDDAVIAGLQHERLRAVLDTKIKGVLNLESATESEDLDFFVLYSSATTLIGSPGQAAYVAANAFLEGFAERRRAAGKSALAIGWGAIADAGLIARDRKLAERLQQSTGVAGVKTAEALAHLGRLLALGSRIKPVQFYSMIAPGPATSRLAILKSPAYASLGLWCETGSADDMESFESALQGKTREEAHAVILRALRREAAQILRMPQEQIDPHRALAEMGFDSLMMLELVISVEKLSGRQYRMVGQGDQTLATFATEIMNEIIIDADDASPSHSSLAPMMRMAPSRHEPKLKQAEPQRGSALPGVGARSKD